MLPKIIRNGYYWLYDHKKGPTRWLADGLAYGFSLGVKGLNIQPQQDLTALSIISHRYKFFYIGIPKIATRSFQDFFIKTHAKEYDIEFYETAAGFLKAKEQYPDYFTFSFVRNPWARIVSTYNSKIAEPSLNKRARIMSFHRTLEPGMSFDDFVWWLCGEHGRDDCADRHWLSQHVFLEDAQGQPLYNSVGQFETLEADLNAVCEQISMPSIALPHKGWISENNDYRSYYTDETRDAIVQRYARDIELFGYEF